MASKNSQLKEAIAVLKKGGVVVFPTETSYGMAADATNSRAIERIFAIKGRELGKTPPLIVADLAMAETYIRFTPMLKKLARQFWPGPLTVVGKGKKKLPSAVVRDGTVALRVSPHPVARALSKALGAPIVATSANVAGRPTCYSVMAVCRQFAGRRLQPDCFVDVGALPRRKPSTIVAEADGKIVLLRQGSLRVPKSYVA